MSSEMVDGYHRHLLPEPRLPLELISMIIGHLHDDKVSLRACSVVCKTWTCSARFHLFSILRVGGQHTIADHSMQTLPAVIPFVRHLFLNRRQQWNETLPLLVGFQRLRSLTVTGLFVHLLDANALAALFHNFSAAVDVRLDNIRFATIGQVVCFICSFPRLQRLSLYCHDLYSCDFALDLPTLRTFTPSPHLRVLELDSICMDAVLRWFLSLPDRPALRTVGLHPQNNDSMAMGKLLLALENSLESFLISTNISVTRTEWPRLDLHCNTRLRALQIELNGPYDDDAKLVTQMLSRISSSHMEEVGFEVTTGKFDKVGQVRWNEIDAALQQSSFSGLKTVNVRIVHSDDVELWNPAVVSWVVNHMPQCHARRILHVRETKWQYSYFLP